MITRIAKKLGIFLTSAPLVRYLAALVALVLVFSPEACSVAGSLVTFVLSLVFSLIVVVLALNGLFHMLLAIRGLFSELFGSARKDHVAER